MRCGGCLVVKFFSTILFLLCPIYLLHYHTIINSGLRHSSAINDSVTVFKDVLFEKKPLVIWSNDYHISPIQDLKDQLAPLGVKFIDKSLSGHCHITNTCGGRSNLKVINVGNAMDLSDSTLSSKFYDAYVDDPEMQSVDAFVCFHPTAMCELFERFNRSLLIIASTRYELGRFGGERWISWNNNLQRYGADEKNVVAGNNLYDAEYIRYFTGLPARVFTSYCGYIKDRYNGSRPGFLLAPIHNGGFADVFAKSYAEVCARRNCTVELTSIRTKYPSYQYSDLAAHQGIVYVPYQVSVMSLFEQYRMNIPLLFPSLDLLAQWQEKYMVMNERTWDGTYGGRPDKSAIRPHQSQSLVPDPNNERDLVAIKYWIRFADFYQFPHIIYYDSFEDLADKLHGLNSTELMRISRAMSEYNTNLRTTLRQQWTEVLLNIAKHSPNKPH